MNLISAILGIGLIALTIGAGISYVNPGASSGAETTATVASGFQTLVQAYQSRQMTGAPPPDDATWKNALFPAYGFEPAPPAGTSWSYGSSDAGRWFCLTAPKATQALRASLAAVGKRFSAASYQVGDKCGAAPAAAGGSSAPAATAAATAAAAAAGGNSVSATLWVSREGS